MLCAVVVDAESGPNQIEFAEIIHLLSLRHLMLTDAILYGR